MKERKKENLFCWIILRCCFFSVFISIFLVLDFLKRNMKLRPFTDCMCVYVCILYECKRRKSARLLTFFFHYYFLFFFIANGNSDNLVHGLFLFFFFSPLYYILFYKCTIKIVVFIIKLHVHRVYTANENVE